MRQHATSSRWRLGRAAAVSIVGLGILVAATGAQAHDERHWKHRGPPFVPPGHVYYARPVVYAPRPVVVYPAPVVYEPVAAYPAYYGPPPGLNINLNVPLR